MELWLKKNLTNFLNNSFRDGTPQQTQAATMIAVEELHEFLFPDQTSQQHIQFLNDVLYLSDGYQSFGQKQGRLEMYSANIGLKIIGLNFFANPIAISNYNRTQVSMHEGINDLEISYYEYWNHTLKHIFSPAPVNDLTTLVPHWHQTHLKKYLARQNLAKHLFKTVYSNTQDPTTTDTSKRYSKTWQYILSDQNPINISKRQEEIKERDLKKQRRFRAP